MTPYVKIFFTLFTAVALGGCVTTTTAPPAEQTSYQGPPPVSSSQALSNFRLAVQRVEPVAEQMCRTRTPGVNCDFLIQIDPNKDAPVNAYQSLTRSGRPTLTFTQSLIADARNIDEIAFVASHEAAHHIEQHIARQQQSAVVGAIFGGIIAAATGVEGAAAETYTDIGATVGARRFSKEHELEADALGAQIAINAGFDPVRGAEFFNRIPDPGDVFLGTHPPNADRIATVERVAANSGL